MTFSKSRVLAFGLAFGAVCTVAGLSDEASADQCGMASWYKMGSTTASGEHMNANAYAAAHRTLPFGARVRVENLANGHSVIVRINDRGPYAARRIIDVTRSAAIMLGMIDTGTARVRLTALDTGVALTGCS